MSDAQIHFPRTTKSGRRTALARLLHSRKLKNAAEAEERVTEPPTSRNVDFFLPPSQDGSDKMPSTLIELQKGAMFNSDPCQTLPAVSDISSRDETPINLRTPTNQ